MKNDEKYMKLAVAQAQKAFQNDEVPVGCVIVFDDQVVGKGYNQKEKKHCSVYHAEIVAIENACKKIGDWRLNGATLYVTMEPCAMCAGAIVNHRISRVVIGVMEPNFGACGSGVDILNNDKLNTHIKVESGILQEECKNLLQSFFKEKRAKQ